MNGVEQLKSEYKKNGIGAPRLHFVLGSGLASAFDADLQTGDWEFAFEIPFASVQGLTSATVPGHKGLFRYYRNNQTGESICFQVGRLHGYEGLDPRDVVKPVILSHQAGTRHFVLTNAAGSLKPHLKIGSVMVIRDHVNLTGRNPLAGPNPTGVGGQPLGPRFPDMSAAYNPELSQHLKMHLAQKGFDVSEGVYIGLLGPSFETPAEIRLFANWGLDAVGMSTVWETIALQHAGATVAGLSVLSNLGCGLSDEILDHEKILGEMEKVGRRVVESLFAFSGTGPA